MTLTDSCLKKNLDPIRADCLEWLWVTNPVGYGQITISGKKHGAHRVAWERWNNKKIPNGLRALHLCDNRSCVEPTHLFLGTQLDNMRDMVAKGRNKNKYSRNPKISKSDATFLRELDDKGGISHSELAKWFGVSQTAISKRIRQERLKSKGEHVDG